TSDFPIWNSGLPWATSPLLLIEWSADCNSDGIVDFGQIRAGDLEDSNANNIPDCCEQGTACFCPGDTNDDGTVDGIDLATILTRWGQSGSKFPDADCNNDGVIDGSDLAVVLGSWGSCPANAG
ncbi:MAG: dockerin type I domain-containing protein, partial [Phycisphaerales bacterium]